MTQTILKHLKDVEQEHNVHVLFAVESGSRAWGFSSSDSDWDVRFIYVHPVEWYLKVEEDRDVIEYMYDDEVDLVGWELRKALRLFARGNPSLFEWLHSPIVYSKNESFVERLLGLEADYFNPIHSIYHYHRIYVKHDERYLQREGFPMKRFLYYLRGVLACQWIYEYQTLPPVPFEELVAATVPEEKIRKEVTRLLELKRQSKEHDMMIVSPMLLTYVQKKADFYRRHINAYRPALLRQDRRHELDSLLYDFVTVASD